jgi:hypothetical protein
VRFSWTIVLVTCVLLAGCSGTSVVTPPETSTNAAAGAPLQGMVHGGQQAIVGAKVYLYAAAISGYGQPSVSLLQSTGNTTKDTNGHYYVTTQTGGTFNITGDYTCPSTNAYAQVYLYSIGGDPGLGEGANSSAGLLAALGNCSSLGSAPFIVVNEVSTVATAYAIAGYATDATDVSTDGNSTLQQTNGITNAFATTSNLEVLSVGLPPTSTKTPGGNGTIPQREIDTLADILAACVNSNGTVTGGATPTPCYTLFTNALAGGTSGAQPTDTATAAINIAHNPWANVSTLFGLSLITAPFEPTLNSAPNDFTVAITYTGSGLDGTGFAPEGIAIDDAGNVWVPNYLSSNVSEFNSNGVANKNSPFTSGLNDPTSVAIDIYGSAWVTSYNGDTVSAFTSSGAPISGSGGGLNNPYGIAFDKTNHSWIANFGGNSLSEFSSTLTGGTPITGTNGFTDDSLVGPAGIASDNSGNIWTVNYAAATSSVTKAVPSSSPGLPPTFSAYEGAGLSSPYGAAVDAGGNVWATNRSGNSGGGSISELNSAGAAISPDPDGFTGGGVDDPYGIAIDGAGNVWIANNGGVSGTTGNSISEYKPGATTVTAISGPLGYVASGLVAPYGIAIDGSGNVWVASDNTSGPLTEFVGAAVPVVTPLAAGVAYDELGTRP